MKFQICLITLGAIAFVVNGAPQVAQPGNAAKMSPEAICGRFKTGPPQRKAVFDKCCSPKPNANTPKCVLNIRCERMPTRFAKQPAKVAQIKACCKKNPAEGLPCLNQIAQGEKGKGPGVGKHAAPVGKIAAQVKAGTAKLAGGAGAAKAQAGAAKLTGGAAKAPGAAKLPAQAGAKPKNRGKSAQAPGQQKKI